MVLGYGKKTTSFENGKYSVDKDQYELYLRQSKILKAMNPHMNTQLRNHKLLTQIPGELEHAIKFRFNQSCAPDDIANTLNDVGKRTHIWKNSLNRGKSFKEKQPYRVENKDKPKIAEVTSKKNTCHDCG
ncbi:hypothetical protein O181_014089 [Austropuccinia psidii MF-1]|uniref:Uncharacterized protein n=1 Tax=Austropuccinia psidii MF-1 TaxID=1389203 RepID=A0A9Q3BXJ1_9BASI|nr:hypothetical protein [Austropuccinia psidii MF-1]